MRCFFQADDCGLTTGITQDIVSCLGKGPLGGAGVIMGAPHDAEAVALLTRHENIAVGVHLNLLEGFAAAAPQHIPQLADGSGRFRHSLASLAAELFFAGRKKKRLLQAVETEFRAQMDRFLSLAPHCPLRLDSHLHIHVLPPLRPLLLGLAREYRASYVRVPAELFHIHAASPLELAVGEARRALLACWASPLRGLLAAAGIECSDFFIGAFACGRMTPDNLHASLRKVLRKNSAGTIEIMTHPGGLRHGENSAAVKAAYRGFYTSEARTAERDMLVSPALAAMLQSLGVTPYFPASRRGQD